METEIDFSEWPIPRGYTGVRNGVVICQGDRFIDRRGRFLDVSHKIIGTPNDISPSGGLLLVRPSFERVEQPEEVPMAGGKVASSKCPPYILIPRVAWEMLANQCGLGVERKKDKAWNALSNNQEVLVDREFVLERINHGINHALNTRDRILENNFENMDTENDAAAVMWCGMFLCAALDAMMKQRKQAAIGVSIDEQMQDLATADAVADTL